MLELRTETEIDAPVERVWQVLMDFDSYPRWNPFIRSIRGTPEVGSRLEVEIGASGTRPLRRRTHRRTHAPGVSVHAVRATGTVPWPLSAVPRTAAGNGRAPRIRGDEPRLARAGQSLIRGLSADRESLRERCESAVRADLRQPHPSARGVSGCRGRERLRARRRHGHPPDPFALR